MKVWVEDADDVDEITDGILYEPAWIKDFLNPLNDKTFLLVATKGFGKTLLLRGKRLRLESQRGKSYTIVPSGGSLVDKPPGTTTVFSAEDISSRKNDRYWEVVWFITISITVLKALGLYNAEALRGPISNTEIKSPVCKTIMDHFPSIAGLSPKDLYSSMIDYQSVLLPVFRQIHTPFATFLDNIDQYFQQHLDRENPPSLVSGMIDREIWYDAQVGLARAIRALHGINHHVKIFASIRSEAFQKLLDSAEGQQFRGNAVMIDYGYKDLKQIFENNLSHVSRSSLSDPNEEDLYAKFFGKSNVTILHPYVGEPEHIFDYVLRHTLFRPRDLMTIGRSLNDLDGSARDLAAIRSKVDESSTQIAKSYLRDVSEHFSNVIDFDTLWSLIPRNILSMIDLRNISVEYNKKIYGKKISENNKSFVHVFCALYKSGLLGYLTRKPGGQSTIQKFELPGKKLFLGDNILPDSRYFILHPILDALIRERSREFAKNFDPLNFGGYERPWRDSSSLRGVAKIDVVGYSEIMKSADKRAAFKEIFRPTVEEAGARLEHAKIEGGDSVLLIDLNPINLVSAIRSIAQELRSSVLRAEIRCGCDVGVLIRNISGNTAEYDGMCLRTAARIEGAGIKGLAIFTPQFLQSAKDIDPKFRSSDASKLSGMKLQKNGTGYVIQKDSGYDEPIVTNLHYIDLLE